MTIKHYTTLALAAALGLTTSAAAVEAQVLDSSSTVRIETGADLGSEGGAGLDVSADARTTATSSAATDAQALSATSSMGAMVQGDGTLAFSFDRKSLDDGTVYSIDDVARVQSSAGLESYAATSVRDDERLESVSLEDNMLSVRYKTDAKFLGFIPASMSVHATVDANGAVTVRYPWYAFLMSSFESRTELVARLTKEQGSIRDEISEASVGMTAGSGASVEARQWALMLERLRSSLYANSSVEART